MRSIWERYYGDAKAVVYCIDAHDTVHWQESLNVLQEVLTACPHVPVLIFCCKGDLEGAKSVDEVKEFFKISEGRVRFFSALSLSPADYKGIAEGFMWLERKLEEMGMD